MTETIDLVDFTRAFFGGLSDINQQANDAEVQRKYEHEDEFSKWLDKKGYKVTTTVTKGGNNEGIHT